VTKTRAFCLMKTWLVQLEARMRKSFVPVVLKSVHCSTYLRFSTSWQLCASLQSWSLISLTQGVYDATISTECSLSSPSCLLGWWASCSCAWRMFVRRCNLGGSYWRAFAAAFSLSLTTSSTRSSKGASFAYSAETKSILQRLRAERLSRKSTKVRSG